MPSTNNRLLQAILDKVAALEKKIDGGFKEVKKAVVENGKRIDRLGFQLAELDDDAPTKDEFNELTQRVEKVESRQVTPD